MFTLETAIDSYTQSAKQALAYVQPEQIRKNLISLADKQADLAKSINKSISTYVTEVFSLRHQ